MNIEFSKIKSIKSLGVKKTIDLEVDSEFHNFYCGDIIVSNSHSVGYAYLTAATTYLKANYTVEYFTCLLNSTQYEQKPIEEISKIQSELPYFGIKLLPPDLLKSNIKFSVDDGNIRFGLSFIKGISEKTIDKINQFKRHYSNKFEIFQAASESGLSIGHLSCTIKSGAMDSFIDNPDKRSKLCLEAQLWGLLTDREKELCLQYAQQYDFQIFKLVKDLNEKLKNEKSKPLIKDSRLATLKKHYLPYKEIYEQNHKNEKFSNWYFEYQLLGFSYSRTLKEIFSEKQPDLLQIKDFNDTKLERTGRIVGIVKECKLTTSREKKTKYIRLNLFDETGEITVLMFNTKKEDKIEECLDLNGKLPDENDIVIVRGTKKKDVIFADVIANQTFMVYSRLSELKSKNQPKEEEKTIDIV